MILGTSRSVRVFAYPEPFDVRKGYDGLYGPVVGRKSSLRLEVTDQRRRDAQRPEMCPASRGFS